ncbi:MAG: DUF1207 domain-containing protein [Proteobacteria bacterium]|nr:DUF1207 domain-containing protein [Pseudomonadota bacterium]
MPTTRRHRAAGALAAVALAVLAPLAARAAIPERSDAFLRGYVTAVLERELRVASAGVRVEAGVVTVPAAGLAEVSPETLVAALAGIEGVRRVVLAPKAASAAPPEPPAAPGLGAGAAQAAPADEGAARRPAPEAGILPRGRLFAPVLADPRWPHFSAAYHAYMGDSELDNVAATSFGETFALVRGAGDGGAWELGVQAGVFAIFDLDAASKDLVNADYLVGFPLTYRRGPLSALVRLFHQSSHLGDEYLLRNRVHRVNLSYEAVNALLSYDLAGGWRLYGGGGALLHREPSDLERLSVQFGVEYRSPETLLGGRLRPIAAFDLQSRQESGWRADLAARAGVQVEAREGGTQQVQVTADYFNGRNPNGQFYERTIEYLGLGVHVYF